MDDKQRHQRLRLLIKKLNKDRKKQNQKIDILCNDLISAQRSFIKRLGIISFMVNFYESILGITDLNKLLYTTAEFIKAENEDINITFFLRQESDTQESYGHSFCGRGPISQKNGEMGTQKTAKCGSFDLLTFENDQPTSIDRQYIENCFTEELTENISRSNKVCTLDDMYAMGLHGNLNELNKISAVTIPMGLFGNLPLGFMLVYRSSEKATPFSEKTGKWEPHKLTCDEIDRISAVSNGLSRAIISCRTIHVTRES